MRKVDRFIGIPLCWLTGLWLSLFSKRRPIKHTEEWNTILVIKFFGMGSLLLSTPFLSALRRHAPKSKIIYLTFSSNKQLLDKLAQPNVKLEIRTSSIGAFMVDTFEIIRTLRKMSIDVVFDLEFFSKYSTLVSSLSGAALRVGYELPTHWRRWNLTHPIALDHKAHVTSVFLRQLTAFNVNAPSAIEIDRIEASPDEITSMERKLQLGSNGVEIICVNINAGPTSLQRRWEPRRFAEVLLQMLVENRTRRFHLIGNSEEREYVQKFLDVNPRLADSAINCAGLLTIGELIALLRRCSLLLTNDSGPMHIATSTGTPVVALFGPESPHLYGPLGNARVAYKGISCSPCLNIYNAKLFVCPYNARCMKEISTNEVVTAARSLLPVPQPAHV